MILKKYRICISYSFWNKHLFLILSIFYLQVCYKERSICELILGKRIAFSFSEKYNLAKWWERRQQYSVSKQNTQLKLLCSPNKEIKIASKFNQFGLNMTVFKINLKIMYSNCNSSFIGWSCSIKISELNESHDFLLEH